MASVGYQIEKQTIRPNTAAHNELSLRNVRFAIRWRTFASVSLKGSCGSIAAIGTRAGPTAASGQKLSFTWSVIKVRLRIRKRSFAQIAATQDGLFVGYVGLAISKRKLLFDASFVACAFRGPRATSGDPRRSWNSPRFGPKRRAPLGGKQDYPHLFAQTMFCLRRSDYALGAARSTSVNSIGVDAWLFMHQSKHDPAHSNRGGQAGAIHLQHFTL